MKKSLFQNRNMSKSLCLACLLSVTVATVSAQTSKDGLSRNVVVERDYAAGKIEAEKINPVPQEEEKYVPDSGRVECADNVYVADIVPAAGKVSATGYEVPGKGNAKNGIFKAGLGFYWQTLGEFYYPLLKGDKYLLDINVRHRSDWGHIKLDDGTSPRAMDHLTEAEMNFESQFSTCRLVSSIDFSTGGFDYYGMSTVPAAYDIMKDTTGVYTTVGADFLLYSTDIRDEIQYSADVAYRYMGRNFGLRQHDVKLSADVSGEAGSGRVGGNVAVNMHFFGTDAGISPELFPSNATIRLTPYYKWTGDNWDLSLGANLFVFAQKDAKLPVAGSAEIKGNFGLVPGLFQLYAGITGDYSDNNYWSVLQENHYIRPDLNISPTYTPVKVDLGIKVNIMKGLLFDLGFDYSLILDQYYYVNDSLAGSGLYYNTFTTVSEALTNRVGVKAGLYINMLEGLDIKITGRYDYWGVSENVRAWQKPSWEVVFDAKYRFLEKWQVGLSYDFLGGRYASVAGKEIKMNDVHDLNVYVSYDVLDWLTVFAKGKNLINNKSDSYYGYRDFGINALAGVSMFF